METVADLAAVRQRHAERWRDRALLAPNHPALRWFANGDESTAHRRAARGVEQTACGLPAVSLVLANGRAPGCPECYPT